LTGITSLFLINPAGAAIPIEHWTQASGVQVYLVQSQAIPMVDVQIDFDAGSRRDPPERAGLASVTASMTAKGVLAGKVQGTQAAEPALDENALSEAWADLGASFGAGASSDRMSFSLRSLTYPDLLSQAIQLAARQLGEPAFPDAIWQRERQTLSAALNEANTRPATLAARAFNTAVYGQHPYGFEMTPESLARIGVDDMKTVYRTLIQPCRAKVTVVGAVNRVQADALVTQLFARLPANDRASAASAGLSVGCPALPVVAEVAPLDKAVEQPIAFDSAQAHVLIGQPGYKRDDPDYFALTVGNYILGGGGFVSRLTNEVREKRGLTYSIYSYFAPALHAGAFTLGLQTRPDQATQAVQVAREVVADFVAKGPLDAELQAAKDNLIGGFALRIDSNRKLLDNVANIAWNNLALDYLDTWTQQVEKVTAADVKAAFARKLQPQQMVTVVLGGAVPAN
jgi:zinc protease